MTRSISISLLSVLLLSSAQVVAGAESKSPTPTEQQAGSEQTTIKQIKAFQQVKIGLLGAIAAIQNEKGGQVIDVNFGVADTRPVYMVKTYQNKQVWEGMIDGHSGKVIDEGSVTSESDLDDEDKAELAGLLDANVSLADAVNTAEKSVGGKAINAGLEETNGHIVYEITVVQKLGASKKVSVDPKTGQING